MMMKLTNAVIMKRKFTFMTTIMVNVIRRTIMKGLKTEIVRTMMNCVINA